MPRDPLHRLNDIQQAILDIKAFTEGFDRTRFLATPTEDRKTFKAVSASLIEIGEAVKALPGEITGRHPSIPWRAISSMRDRVAHEYFQLDVDVVWATLEQGELDQLLDVIVSEIQLAQQATKPGT